MINNIKPLQLLWLPLILSLLFACNSERQNNETSKGLVQKMQCLAEQSQCFLEFDGGRAEILFDVNRIVAEQAFNISVNYSGIETITSVTGYLEGVDMFMGKIPLFLERNTDDTVYGNANLNPSTSQDFIGEVLVGSCSAEQMTWRMWLTFTTEDKQTHNKMLTIVSHRS